MKLLTALTLLVVNSLAFASTMNLTCKASQNAALVFETTVALTDGSKNVAVGTLGTYEILLSSLGGSKLELQAYNPVDPSRTYATSTGASVALSIWTRDVLMDVSCSTN